MFRNNAISKLSDEELLYQHKELGKDVCFEELFNRYLPLLYGVYLKYLKDTDDAKDAVIQLFGNLRYKIADYEIDEFRPWIYSVAKNHCSQILQKEAHIITVDFDDSATEYNSVMYLLEDSDYNEQTVLLSECMNKLPEQQRLSLNYFFVNKLSYAEIVDKTGYTLKHVKSYIQSGKQKIKVCLENNGQ